MRNLFNRPFHMFKPEERIIPTSHPWSECDGISASPGGVEWKCLLMFLTTKMSKSTFKTEEVSSLLSSELTK